MYVVSRAFFGLAQHLVCVGDGAESFFVAGVPIVGMVALGQQPVDAVNHIGIRIGTDLQQFVVVGNRFVGGGGSGAVAVFVGGFKRKSGAKGAMERCAIHHASPQLAVGSVVGKVAVYGEDHIGLQPVVRFYAETEFAGVDHFSAHFRG